MKKNSPKNMVEIVPYRPEFQAQVIDLILEIEIVELNVPITLDDQPDLLDIPNFYQSKRGNFWVAINEKSEVVGTIALIDTGFAFGVLRKMFVRKEYRGLEYSIAKKLLLNLNIWAIKNHFTSILLGTHTDLEPATRFYEKHCFAKIPKNDLPGGFPIMPVNNVFFEKKLTKPTIRLAILTDIPGVLDLQSRYLFAHLSEVERAEGFVTTPFTEAQIERVILKENGLYVAIAAEKIVGYAFGASWGYWSQWPIFEHMVSRMPLVKFRGVAISTENSYQYGPICLDKKMRGMGVGEGLFGAVRASFADRYAVGLTFINQVNALSTAFHTRKLGLEIVDEFEFLEKKYFGLAFLNQ